MNKFKVGNRVRVSDKELEYYNDIATVNEIFNNDYTCTINGRNGRYVFIEHSLELVEKKENDMKENKEFTLSDLTDDMIVEWKDGEKFLVISNGEVLLNNRDWNLITNYNNDLSNIRYDQFSIIKVWKIISKQGYTNLINLLTDDYISIMIKYNKIELVYDRNKPQSKKMTVQQICDELGYEVEIVKE